MDDDTTNAEAARITEGMMYVLGWFRRHPMSSPWILVAACSVGLLGYSVFVLHFWFGAFIAIASGGGQSAVARLWWVEEVERNKPRPPPKPRAPFVMRATIDVREVRQ